MKVKQVDKFRTLCGNWFECKQFIIDDQVTKGDIVSIDPGLKTYITYYSEGYGKGYIGTNMQHTMILKLEKIDKVHTSLKKCINDKIKYKIIKAKNNKIKKKTVKFKRIMDEIQYRSAVFLAETFKIILLPKFRFELLHEFVNDEIKELVVQSYDKLYKDILSKCKENGSYVIMVDEKGTTKKCSKCGINNYPQGRKYNCAKCGLNENRDMNACINIHNDNLHLCKNINTDNWITKEERVVALLCLQYPEEYNVEKVHVKYNMSVETLHKIIEEYKKIERNEINKINSLKIFYKRNKDHEKSRLERSIKNVT